MDEHELASRLRRISTIWSLLQPANQAAPPASQEAQLALIQRYQGAVYRYLRGAVRDPNVADDLLPSAPRPRWQPG